MPTDTAVRHKKMFGIRRIHVKYRAITTRMPERLI